MLKSTTVVLLSGKHALRSPDTFFKDAVYETPVPTLPLKPITRPNVDTGVMTATPLQHPHSTRPLSPLPTCNSTYPTTIPPSLPPFVLIHLPLHPTCHVLIDWIIKKYQSSTNHCDNFIPEPHAQHTAQRRVSGIHIPWMLVRYVHLSLSAPIERMVRTAHLGGVAALNSLVCQPSDLA